MWRVIRWLIPLALITFGLLWPLVFRGDSAASDVSDPVVFSNYKADFVVNRDGRLDAVETITAEFPSGRHGIFRYWDVANQNSPRVRQKPEITSILLDGRPAPYQMLWEDGERFRVAKIGDPDQYLSWGTHVFEIRYSIAGVLDPGTTGADKTFAAGMGAPSTSPSVFFWNVIAPSWNNTIDNAEISVTLPGDVGRVQCSVGYGLGRACRDLTIEGNTVTLAATNLAPRTPVTVRAGVDVPTPPRISLPWPYTWDRVLGQSVTGVVWIAGLTVAFGLGAFLWYRTTVEPSPGFPLQYAPPPGLGPVQTEYIRTETVPKNGLTATLFYLAERRLVDLRQVNEKQWNIRGTAERGAWADVDPVSVAGRLGAEGDEGGHRIRGQTHRQVRPEAEQGQDRHGQGRREMGVRQRADGQAQEGTMGPNRQRDRVSPDAVRLLPVGLPDHDVGPAVRGVLPAVDSVVGRRRR